MKNYKKSLKEHFAQKNYINEQWTLALNLVTEENSDEYSLGSSPFSKFERLLIDAVKSISEQQKKREPRPPSLLDMPKEYEIEPKSPFVDPEEQDPSNFELPKRSGEMRSHGDYFGTSDAINHHQRMMMRTAPIDGNFPHGKSTFKTHADKLRESGGNPLKSFVLHRIHDSWKSLNPSTGSETAITRDIRDPKTGKVIARSTSFDRTQSPLHGYFDLTPEERTNLPHEKYYSILKKLVVSDPSIINDPDSHNSLALNLGYLATGKKTEHGDASHQMAMSAIKAYKEGMEHGL